MDRNEKKEILNGIQNQIASFDSKASIFIAAIGIVFAVVISLFDVFHSEWFSKASDSYQIWFKVLFCVFLLVTISLLLMFVLVLVPRKSFSQKKYGNYYRDISLTNRNELDAMLHDYSMDDELLTDQIKINADICGRKHLFIFCGELLLMPFVLLITILILFCVFI